MDVLGRVLDLQRQLMERLNVPTDGNEQPLRSQLVKDVLIMLASEVQEALNPLTLQSKPWKHADEVKLEQEFYEEVVDILFLYAELLIVLGIDADRLNMMYSAKMLSLLVNRLGVPYEKAAGIVYSSGV